MRNSHNTTHRPKRKLKAPGGRRVTSPLPDTPGVNLSPSAQWCSSLAFRPQLAGPIYLSKISPAPLTSYSLPNSLQAISLWHKCSFLPISTYWSLACCSNWPHSQVPSTNSLSLVNTDTVLHTGFLWCPCFIVHCSREIDVYLIHLKNEFLRECSINGW